MIALGRRDIRLPPGGGAARNFGNADFLKMARRLGASDTIAKPFDPDVLLAIVKNCLAGALAAATPGKRHNCPHVGISHSNAYIGCRAPRDPDSRHGAVEGRRLRQRKAPFPHEPREEGAVLRKKGGHAGSTGSMPLNVCTLSHAQRKARRASGAKFEVEDTALRPLTSGAHQ